MATIKNAITMQDRMTPVFSKMLTAMQSTLRTMEQLDTQSNTMMRDTAGLANMRKAMNQAKADVASLAREIDALNGKSIRPTVLQTSSAVKPPVVPVSNAAMPTPPKISTVDISNASVKRMSEFADRAQEAQTSVEKTNSVLNGIRAPGVTQIKDELNKSEQLSRSISSNLNSAQPPKIPIALEDLPRIPIPEIPTSGASKIKDELGKANQHSKGINDNLRLLNVAAAVSLAQSLYQAVSASAQYLDNLTSIKARLDNINDGTQTTLELQGKILAAANRSRAAYQDIANTVAKLNLLAGDTFTSNDEAISFAEQLNKMFVISGTSAQEASNAMYQLNQAMASGRLQGDEFRSIIENAPMLANVIAESMGVSRAELKTLSSEGAITADVIKQAMIDCTDEVNRQFANMPMTFGQAMNLIGNTAVSKFQAVANSFSNMINSSDIQVIADTIGVVIQAAAMIAVGAINALSAAFGFLSDNIQWIGPILAGIVASLGVYAATALLSATATGILTAAKMLAVPIYAALTGATMAETAAQWGLNAAIYACPITWIIIAIIMLIALFYAAIGLLNLFAGTSISATGVVAGVFFALGAFIANIFIAIWNVIAFFINWFVRIWNNPEYAAKLAMGNIAKGILQMAQSGLSSVNSLATAIANAFISAANSAIGAINKIIEVLNKLPGVNIGTVGKLSASSGVFNGAIDGLSGMMSSIDDWVGSAPSGWGDNAVDYGSFMNIGDAFNSGYEWGSNLESSLGNMLDSFGSIPDMSGITSQLDDIKESALSGANPTVNGGNVGSVGSVGSVDEPVELSDDDIKMLKDIASTKFINKFTTLQPNMSVSFGDVHETADVNKIMEAIETMTEQALAETILEE